MIMPRPITAEVFQTALDLQNYPEQDRTSCKRLVNEIGEFCFTGIHKLKQHHIPAIYITLDKKASQWANKKNGIPEIPDIKFNGMTSQDGDYGIECILRFPRNREIYLFLNPADKSVKSFLGLLGKSEIIAFSFYLHQSDMVYAAYVSSAPEIQAWAQRNQLLAKTCTAENDIKGIMAAQIKMFWLGRKPFFVMGR